MHDVGRSAVALQDAPRLVLPRIKPNEVLPPRHRLTPPGLTQRPPEAPADRLRQAPGRGEGRQQGWALLGLVAPPGQAGAMPASSHGLTPAHAGAGCARS